MLDSHTPTDTAFSCHPVAEAGPTVKEDFCWRSIDQKPLREWRCKQINRPHKTYQSLHSSLIQPVMSRNYCTFNCTNLQTALLQSLNLLWFNLLPSLLSVIVKLGHFCSHLSLILMVCWCQLRARRRALPKLRQFLSFCLLLYSPFHIFPAANNCKKCSHNNKLGKNPTPTWKNSMASISTVMKQLLTYKNQTNQAGNKHKETFSNKASCSLKWQRDVWLFPSRRVKKCLQQAVKEFTGLWGFAFVRLWLQFSLMSRSGLNAKSLLPSPLHTKPTNSSGRGQRGA